MEHIWLQDLTTNVLQFGKNDKTVFQSIDLTVFIDGQLNIS